jgi:hypothetical protein
MRTFKVTSAALAGIMLATPAWLAAQAPPPPIRPLPGGSYLGIGIQEISGERA